MALLLKIQEVPSQLEFQEQGIAWVGLQRKNLSGCRVKILNRPFVVQATSGLTANEMALAFHIRQELRLGIGEFITVKGHGATQGPFGPPL